MESAIFGGLITMAAALWFGLYEIAKAINPHGQRKSSSHRCCLA